MDASPRKISFVDCIEIGQGGPEVCSIVIDGRTLQGKKFDPSYIEFPFKLLAPVRTHGRGGIGYALAVIDTNDLSVRNISKLYPYMKIVQCNDNRITIITDLGSAATAVVEMPVSI